MSAIEKKKKFMDGIAHFVLRKLSIYTRCEFFTPI